MIQFCLKAPELIAFFRRTADRKKVEHSTHSFTHPARHDAHFLHVEELSQQIFIKSTSWKKATRDAREKE